MQRLPLCPRGLYESLSNLRNFDANKINEITYKLVYTAALSPDHSLSPQALYLLARCLRNRSFVLFNPSHFASMAIAFIFFTENLVPCPALRMISQAYFPDVKYPSLTVRIHLNSL